MSNEYRNNHYVPVWYQKRFALPNQPSNELFYMDLHPKVHFDSKGASHTARAVRRLGFKHCFMEPDLYTTKFGAERSTVIEERFFGKIDSAGNNAVEHYSKFAYPWNGENALHDMMMFMSTQKLRTPKGLGWLSEQLKGVNKDELLKQMLRLRQLHCAIWTECVWQIADATKSETKFIISDHPVTVYNRRCGPRSQWCRGFNDPDIRFQATHTLFPLALDKILILTNLSWVRNPYQSEVGVRPNPNPFRSAIFKITDIQTLRHLSEEEVRQINFIIKTPALRYISSGKEEWLYPEKHVSKSQWNVYGDGYLFMPDPRAIHLGGEIMWGNADGTGGAMDEYGRRPWDKDYGVEGRTHQEGNTLYRFKGEFARRYGPYRRGRSFETTRLEDERDTDEFHQYHLGLEKSKGRIK